MFVVAFPHHKLLLLEPNVEFFSGQPTLFLFAVVFLAFQCFLLHTSSLCLFPVKSRLGLRKCVFLPSRLHCLMTFCILGWWYARNFLHFLNMLHNTIILANTYKDSLYSPSHETVIYQFTHFLRTGRVSRWTRTFLSCLLTRGSWVVLTPPDSARFLALRAFNGDSNLCHRKWIRWR